jgi:hypothetical protein
VRTRSRRWLVAGLVAATGAGALALAGCSAGGSRDSTTSLGTGHAAASKVAAADQGGDAPLDALTQNEVQKAQELAVAAATSRLRATATPGGRRGRPEVVLTDQRTDKADKARRADVYLYDYATDQGAHAVVNVAGNKVESLVSKRGLQPAPSPAETSRAVQVLLDDKKLGPELRAMYKGATGQELRSPTDVWSQALIFKARTATGVAGVEKASQCGAHRCFQLFVRVPGGKWVDTTRLVIDMSARHAIVLG